MTLDERIEKIVTEAILGLDKLGPDVAIETACSAAIRAFAEQERIDKEQCLIIANRSADDQMFQKREAEAALEHAEKRIAELEATIRKFAE